MKKALIYDPYLDTMGGGERYVLTFALALANYDYAVDLAWRDVSILTLAKDRFNFDLSQIKINTAAYADLSLSAGLLRRYHATKNYDLTFWVSDGSLPFLFSRQNLLHFQIPFTKLGGNLLTNLAKSARIDRFIYNSQFTKSVVKKQLPFSKSVVIYPPIDTENFTPGKKEDLILSVARFDSPSHAKRQDILINAFKELYQQNQSVKLILAGGLKSGEDYLASLKTAAGKLPVQFIPNPDFGELKKLYAKAKFFWHAAGYDIDEIKEPEKVEHFGITTVEAMAAGAVPIVINKGGQREIVTTDSGYLCDSPEEMVSTTLSLINSPEKLKLLSENSRAHSQEFATARFINSVGTLVGR